MTRRKTEAVTSRQGYHSSDDDRQRPTRAVSWKLTGKASRRRSVYQSASSSGEDDQADQVPRRTLLQD